jgi:spermidine synthase
MCFLFFLSGFSALVNEILWQRHLYLILGVSTAATSAVLAAFMLGIAGGALIFGPIADRCARPLHIYGLIEGGVAFAALIVPRGFAAIEPLYRRAHTEWAAGLWGSMALDLCLAFIVLLIPTILIGGTLPVMGRITAAFHRPLSAAFGTAYAVNTLGGVLGAGTCGFFFIRYVGMEKTQWMSITGSVLAALVALAASRSTYGDKRAMHASRPSSGVVLTAGHPHRLLMSTLAALTGATTFGFEVIWNRILAVFTSSSAVTFALVLTIVLVGLAIGGLLAGRLGTGGADVWKRFSSCQYILAAISIASAWWLQDPPAWFDRACVSGSAVQLFGSELALAVCLVLVPASLMGIGLPLLATLERAEQFGSRLGRLYATNTIACAFGAVITGFILIPALGIRPAIGILAAGILAAAMISRTRSASSRQPFFINTILVGIICWTSLTNHPYQKASGSDLLFYQEGDCATVSVRRDPIGRKWLLVDGQPVAGTGRTAQVDQKMLAHLPLLLHPAPHRALTVGLGSGGTSYAMTLHGIDVDCVEIERAVSAAATQFTSENHGVFASPCFHLILDDARSWLRLASVRYDAIVTDCTNIQYKSNSDLYTVDYFGLIKERLAPGGVAAAWVPADGIDEADLKTLIRSFAKVFPHTSIWFMNTLATDFLIVVGTPHELSINMTSLCLRMAAPPLKADLESIHLDDPWRLVNTLLVSGQQLRDYVGLGPVNTDDRPILSYSTYGASFRQTVARNLTGLLAHRTAAQTCLVDAFDAEVRLRHYAASNEAILGHIAHHLGDERAALAHYLRGAQLLSSDPSFKELVFTADTRVRVDAMALSRN